jgi:hypothetical protein
MYKDGYGGYSQVDSYESILQFFSTLDATANDSRPLFYFYASDMLIIFLRMNL